MNYIDGELSPCSQCNWLYVFLGQLIEGTLIAGAKQPNYLVTADDVGTYLAIEVQPLDDRKRKVSLITSVWFKQIYMVV